MQYIQHFSILLGVLVTIGSIFGIYVKISNRLTRVETKIDMLLDYKGLGAKLHELRLVELDDHEKELAK